MANTAIDPEQRALFEWMMSEPVDLRRLLAQTAFELDPRSPINRLPGYNDPEVIRAGRPLECDIK